MASDVERIKEKLPIEEVIGAYVKLERGGGRLKGRCPFHNEKTPSFFVSPERGTYYCFGCGVKGDIFTFVQEFESLDFRGALKQLADRAGIELTQVAPEKRDEEEQLFELMEKATLYYQKQLAERKDVIKYLTDRGLTIATIKSWRLGFAPDEWKPLSTALIGKGYQPKLIEKAGLTKPSEKNPNDFYDRFRSRIMFPLFDQSGRVVAFTGRIFGDDKESAKYLNSPETALFDKSSYLYGFDRAKLDIRKADAAVLVEGQMDLIMSHQAGITHTVAVSGTSLTDKHIATLARFTKNIVLAFDSDAAGQKASERANMIASGINVTDVGGTATQAVTGALARGVEVKVISIHGGKDPADIVKEDVELWRTMVVSPLHIIDYQLGRAMQESDERARRGLIERLVLPYIAALQSPLDQSHFISKVSLKAGISEKTLQEALQKIPVLDQEYREGVKPIHTALRMDMVERKVAALLLWLMHKKPEEPKEEFVRDYLQKHMGKEVLSRIENLINTEKESLIFESEASYTHAERLEQETKELMHTLHEEFLKKRLAEEMVRLKQAEHRKDAAESKRSLERCQEISGQLHKLKNIL